MTRKVFLRLSQPSQLKPNPQPDKQYKTTRRIVNIIRRNIQSASIQPVIQPEIITSTTVSDSSLGGSSDSSKASASSILWQQLEAATKAADQKQWQAIREELILLYLPLAQKAARQYFESLPYRPLAELNDLLQSARIGLMQAIDKYNLVYHVKFETFAITRIVGAIIDDLRVMQPFSRLISKQRRHIRKLQQALYEKLGRIPTAYEFCQEYGKDYWNILNNPLLKANVYNQCISTGESSDEDAQAFESKYLSVADRIIDSQQKLNRLDIFELCESYLSKQIHKNILYFYYQAGMNLSDIGQMLDPKISASTVSKHLKLVLRKLANVSGLRDELERIEYKET